MTVTKITHQLPRGTKMAKKKSATKEKKPLGRPPVGNFLENILIRVNQEVFEHIESIRKKNGFLSNSDAIRWALRKEAERSGWQPKANK